LDQDPYPDPQRSFLSGSTILILKKQCLVNGTHLAIVNGAKNGDNEQRQEDVEAHLQTKPELREGVSVYRRGHIFNG
jgi:hypothetical protein